MEPGPFDHTQSPCWPEEHLSSICIFKHHCFPFSPSVRAYSCVLPGNQGTKCWWRCGDCARVSECNSLPGSPTLLVLVVAVGFLLTATFPLATPECLPRAGTQASPRLSDDWQTIPQWLTGSPTPPLDIQAPQLIISSD